MEDRKTIESAHEARQSGNFSQAGDYYTAWGHSRYAQSIPASPWLGAGLLSLQRAAICYRLADDPDRSENRCRQGILIAEDMVTRVFESEPEYPVDRARRGVWYEHIGDFRVIGEFGNPDQAYDRAIEVYRDAGDPDTFYAEQEQYPLMEHFNDVGTVIGADPEPIDTLENDLTLVDWVEQKRKQYPDFVDRLVQGGEWP